ncbi:MAG: nicotinate (nicotinamide) nucleotide adenylyltransferase [Deltaproteobacteria bacterium]|jgi:nicotinate-nucleotide adenylyltransferase|nr:nicotinate (nicotinamide) nucleotide adenylyltransferase [Deltaproteobacteria bacterium]MBW2382317.1 nicotinate (nicotinamide) nucleotide adenylyltransferase [Deltaproteobacteria bacterium]MBW2696922.1 nicotinate (nicotinamide) nucleotide adenylyltransferase [Deltaproteobacteria bacterium]
MIGVFGGTFNPIHQGHLRVAEEVVEALALARMLFVPSARPPHKDAGEEIAPPKLRLEWLDLAIADNPLFEADRIEIDRPGPSYLVETLRELAERDPGNELVFVAGQDAFADMGSWRSPNQIFRLAHVLVTSRPPVQGGHLSGWLPECVRDDFEVADDGLSAQHRDAGTWIRALPITALDISASGLRARLRAGRSIRYLVPEPARTAIELSGCYRDPARGARAGNERQEEAK